MNAFLPILAAGLLWARPGIVIDGATDDWAGVPPAFEAKEVDGAVHQVRVSADGGHVFLLFDFRRDSQALSGKVTLLADSDGNTGTGIAVDGLAGVDLAIDVFGGPAIVTIYDNDASHPVPTGAYDLALTRAPNFAARRVEIGLQRGGVVGSRGGLLDGRTIHWKFVARDAQSRIVQQGDFTSSLPAAAPSSRVAQARDPLERSRSTDFRVVLWNVSNRFWLRNPEPYRRILRALQPDIVLLDEVLDATGEDWIRSFLESVKPTADGWRLVFARTGAWERSLVATHFPLASAFDSVSHTDETVTRLGPVLEPFLPKTSPPPRKTLPDGVTASAAFITIGSRTLLATALDLACCQLGEIREAEAVAIAGKLRAALRSRTVDAVVTGGDFNLVSQKRPLDILTSDFDPKGGNLVVDAAINLDGWSHATYRPGPDGRFPRSKLDYLLFSPSRLRVQKFFVFHSGALSAHWQQHHGLLPADSDVSDHLPVVADFSWKE